MVPGLFRVGLLVLASACSTETGVLIEVTRDESVPAEVDRLEFYVGIDKIEAHPSNFVDFDVEDGVAVAGRDLAADPYRLMLRTGDYPDNGIMAAVLALQGREVVGFGALDGPVPFVDGKVTMWTVVLSAQLPDGFSITEQGCLHFVDAEGNYVSIGRPGDLDCDGWIEGDGDCNDLDPGINSGASETCENGIDEDCDLAVDENVDDDGDLVTTCDGDCNDGDPAVNPNADDACDGVDNNCNGTCDDSHDFDGDLFTVCGSRQFEDGTCIIDEGKIDCNDDDETTFPGAAELCDGADNDCDWICDDDSLLDRDGDSYTECGSVIGACGKYERYVDCMPENGAVYPGAPEACDGVDSDCDGMFLETQSCFGRNPDDEGQCGLGVRSCVESGGSGNWAGECTFGAEESLPVGACDAYDTCAADPDPLRCAVEGGLHGECKVNFEAATGLQCPGRVTALPTGGSTTCTWTMLGGTTDVGGHLAGLVPLAAPDGAPALSLDDCDAALRVTTVLDTPPSTAEVIILVRSDAAVDEYFALDLRSVPAAGCSPPSGLVCSGL
jgi:hypothetical protein